MPFSLKVSSMKQSSKVVWKLKTDLSNYETIEEFWYHSLTTTFQSLPC